MKRIAIFLLYVVRELPNYRCGFRNPLAKNHCLLAQGARIRDQGWKSTENLNGEMLTARETTEGVWTKSEHKFYQNPRLTAKLHIFEGTFQGIQQKHRQRSEKKVYLIFLLTECILQTCVQWTECLCPPKFIFWSPNPQFDYIWRGDFWGWTAHESISALLRWGRDQSPPSSPHKERRRQPSTNQEGLHQTHWHLDLVLPRL